MALAACEVLSHVLPKKAPFAARDATLVDHFWKSPLDPASLALETRYRAAHRDCADAREFVAGRATKQIGKLRTAPLSGDQRKPAVGGDFGQKRECFVRVPASAFQCCSFSHRVAVRAILKHSPMRARHISSTPLLFACTPPLSLQNRIELRLKSKIRATDKISKTVEINERNDTENRPAKNRTAFVLRKVVSREGDANAGNQEWGERDPTCFWRLLHSFLPAIY
ncbi:hypothetical protein [Burkholderia sp. MSMB1078WGS]|uniref:hypothetical protein n=1 Tax=Burkholderia sp. MSMB1078WGS TaxID=1637900 RepID=UPI0012E33CC2|nr:hypothetical protein [Burkholderia sp. MSMB1078WGS]